MPLRRWGILSAIRDRIGEVQETPSDNTLLGRLKDLLTGIVLAAGTSVIGKVNANLTQSSTAFFAAAYDTAIGEGVTEDVEADSVAVDVSNVMGEVLITLEGDVENTAFDAYMDCVFILSHDGTDYDEGAYETLSFLFDGSNTTRRRSIPLNISGASKIKIQSIKNNDSSYDLTVDTVNLYLSKKV